MSLATKLVFDADSAPFIASVDKGTAAVARQSEAVTKARASIVAALEAQQNAAKAAGAGHEELARNAEVAARKVANLTDKNADSVVRSYERILDAQKRLIAGRNALGSLVPKAVEGDDITNKQRASALLRGGGLRAGENFASQFDVFNKIAGVAFPILGATMLGGEVVKAAEAFARLWQESSHAAEKIRADYAAIHEKAQISIDDKEIENQKIQDQIDKISGHPNNGLATALLEAKKMADQLVGSLQEDRKQLEALLKEHDTGKFGTALAVLGVGPTTTGKQGEELLKDQQDLLNKVQGLRAAYSKAMSAAPDDAGREAATKAFNRGIHDSFQAQIDAYAAESKRLADAQAQVHVTATRNGVIRSHEDHSQQISNIDGRAQQLRDMLSNQTLDESIYAGDKTLGAAKQKKEDAQRAKEEAEKRLEAQRKAAEEQRKQWDEEHDDLVNAGRMSAGDEVDFWTLKVYSVQAGSANYKAALDKQTAAIAALRRTDLEAAVKADAEAQKAQSTSWDLLHNGWVAAGHRTAEDERLFWELRLAEAVEGGENYRKAYDKATAAILAAQKEAEEADKARSKASLEKGQQRTAYAEAVLGIQVSTGAISRQDAAMQQANIHAEQYRQKIAALGMELARQKALDPGSAGTVNAQAALDQADADRKVQIMQDAAKTAAESWQGALRNANALWVQDSQDSARQVVALYTSALDATNQNIVSFLTNKHGNGRHTTDWRGEGENLAKQGTSDLLKRGESAVLKGLGLAKADGSRGSPFHVLVDNLAGLGGGGGAGGGIGGFHNSLGAAMDSSSSKTAAAIAAIAGGLTFNPGVSLLGGLFGGHRALGGGVKAGVTYDVGEMGREQFTPTSDGVITPNNRLGNGGASYTVNVANGVTPEQMRMHVRQALSEYHPHVVAASVAAVRSDRARNPSTRS
jgi:hypothetical protein